MDVIEFCKILKPEDWKIPVTDKWTVKDTISHLVGWEKEVAQELPKVWKSKQQPWFMATDDYGDFNEKIFEYYKNYSPQELISEFQMWESELERTVKNIGKEKLKNCPDMDWVFDEGDEPHFDHHINQIRKALGFE